MSIKKLSTIDADTLQSIPYAPLPFVVEDLLPQGLHLLAGAPKIGKSWLALWLCLCTAQGKPLWNFATKPCEVLYLCLEDSFQRIQSRLFDLTEDAPPSLHFAVMAEQLHSGLVEQIEQFLQEHPATGLVVIDTLQRIRTAGNEVNPYASDYRDIGVLKTLADRHRIAILLIHHLRKLNDDDPMNMISGTTGLSGATDSNFVLRKNKRGENTATLYCTGRDIAFWSAPTAIRRRSKKSRPPGPCVLCSVRRAKPYSTWPPRVPPNPAVPDCCFRRKWVSPKVSIALLLHLQYVVFAKPASTGTRPRKARSTQHGKYSKTRQQLPAGGLHGL